MRKMIYLYYSMVLLFFGATAVITAETTRTDGGSLFVVTQDEEAKGMLIEEGSFGKDYFWGGATLDFSGEAEDLYLMGRTIDFSGHSAGSSVLLADSVELDGTLEGNVHGAASKIRVSGHLKDTSFLAAESIIVSKEAVIDGTLLSGSSTLNIMGQLNNGLYAGAGEVIIDGPVTGDVNVWAGNFVITERGSISGDLKYSANSELSAEELARVSGSVKYEVEDKIEKDSFSTFCVVATVLFFLTILVAGLLILLLPGVKKLFFSDRTAASTGKTVLWGLIPLFIYPVVTLITIPLYPLAIALALAIFPLMGITTLLGLVLAGQLLFKVFGWEKKNLFLQFLLAFAIFVPLMFIPYVKAVVSVAVMAAGAGLIISKLFNTDF